MNPGHTSSDFSTRDTEPAPADDEAPEGSILDHERSAEYDAEPGADE